MYTPHSSPFEGTAPDSVNPPKNPGYTLVCMYVCTTTNHSIVNTTTHTTSFVLAVCPKVFAYDQLFYIHYT